MTRKERYERILDTFRVTQPHVTTELLFASAFQLLVATVLSAQCTDKRVNQVTPDLFSHYPDARSMAQAEPDDVLEYIRSVSYPNAKARHLVANAELAVKTGVPRNRVVVAEDGFVVDLVNGRASVAGRVPCGLVYVDGSSVGEITEADLKDRRILGEEGFISIIVVVDAASGKVVAGPEIHARGFAETEAVFDKVRPRIVDALRDAANAGSVDTYQLQQVVRRVVGRWVNESYRRRPMIVPLVIEA